jgi:hypothetical protein
VPFRSLWRRFFRPKKSPPARQKPARQKRPLQVESLEARAVPAVLLVTNTNDSGAGSLRAAIGSANSTSVPDTIKFDLPGSGIRTINVATQLPQIPSNRPLTIDGWSQPGFGSSPLVQISSASGASYGLSVFASNSVFRGLIFSGFSKASIALWGGDNNKIQGCYLGSNAAGNAVVGSSDTAAVYLAGGSASNIIGVDGDGTNDANEGNLLVGSSQMGVWLNGGGTTGNRVAGNRIGVSKSGIDLGNAWGVYVSGGASDNIIGSNNDGVGDWEEINTISGNELSGIAIVGTASVGNRISRNYVYGNDKAEIDLEDDGITANDNLDADSGGNKHANFPILRNLTTTATTVTVGGGLSALASTAYRLEFFAAASSDNSGHGGSQRFLGFVNVTTNASGAATFSKSFSTTLAYGWVVSATATDAAGNTSEFSPAIWQGADLASTFALHSNPSASKVIYLDFNGHTTTGTQWNSQYGQSTITSPGYSLDGSASFSDQELINIQRIFYSIAEDFRPFAVNVTTEEPPLADLRKDSSGSDTRWGIRAVIGGTETDVLGDGNAGGRAYTGSFTWNSDTPAFVFSRSLTNGDVQSVAAATSHEVGHTLGLDHDGQGDSEYYAGHGTGATSWGPLMGNPYGRSVSQWSKGSYTGATTTQDDLAIITTQNGFGYRADDHGNTPAAASPLSGTGKTLAAAVLARSSDVDFFSFTIPDGKIDLTASPDSFDPNLDIRLTLLDANSQVVVANNPSASLSARITATVAAGKYYLRVEGVGTGSPWATNPTGYTDYGSLGFYAITGTLPASQPPSIVLSGTIGYTRNATTGIKLAVNATVSDPDSPNFDTGSLIVSIISGGESANRLTLTGGAFTLNGSAVNYNGTQIGTLTGSGFGTTPLSVQFNVNATPAIVQELVRNIRFKTVNSSSNLSRVITFSLSDGDGSTSNTATKTVNVTS